MIDVGSLKVGDRVIWLGSSKSVSYGNRRVPAEIVKIKPERIQIKIETPYGEILKYVSANALAIDKKK
jgi:hypothetical protein